VKINEHQDASSQNMCVTITKKKLCANSLLTTCFAVRLWYVYNLCLKRISLFQCMKPQKKLLHLVSLIHVEQMLNVENKMEQVLVLVLINILEIRTKDADLNVSWILIAHQIVLVYKTNVKIHVQERVVKMLNAKLWITYLHVLVSPVTLEIHSDYAVLNWENVRNLKIIQL
jgi:hypothetical protein